MTAPWFVRLYAWLTGRKGDPYADLFARASRLLEPYAASYPIGSQDQPATSVEFLYPGQVLSHRESGAVFHRRIDTPAVLAMGRSRHQSHLLGQFSVLTSELTTSSSEPGRITAAWVNHVPVELPVEPPEIR